MRGETWNDERVQPAFLPALCQGLCDWHCSIETVALYRTHQVTSSGGVHATLHLFKCKIHLRYWREMTVEPSVATLVQLKVRR